MHTGPGPGADSPDELLVARAEVVHDLAARGIADATAVDVVEDAVAARRWWLDTWPDGAGFVAGQVAQDVQEGLLDGPGRRWPLCATPDCPVAEPHELRIDPDLGPSPHWVCENAGVRVAPLGALPAAG